MRGDAADDGIDVIAAGDVEPPGFCDFALGGDLGGDGFRALGGGVGNGDVGAFGGEHARGGVAVRAQPPATVNGRSLTERLMSVVWSCVAFRNVRCYGFGTWWSDLEVDDETNWISAASRFWVVGGSSWHRQWASRKAFRTSGAHGCSLVAPAPQPPYRYSPGRRLSHLRAASITYTSTSATPARSRISSRLERLDVLVLSQGAVIYRQRRIPEMAGFSRAIASMSTEVEPDDLRRANSTGSC